MHRSHEKYQNDCCVLNHCIIGVIYNATGDNQNMYLQSQCNNMRPILVVFLSAFETSPKHWEVRLPFSLILLLVWSILYVTKLCVTYIDLSSMWMLSWLYVDLATLKWIFFPPHLHQTQTFTASALTHPAWALTLHSGKPLCTDVCLILPHPMALSLTSLGKEGKEKEKGREKKEREGRDRYRRENIWILSCRQNGNFGYFWTDNWCDLNRTLKIPQRLFSNSLVC